MPFNLLADYMKANIGPNDEEVSLERAKLFFNNLQSDGMAAFAKANPEALWEGTIGPSDAFYLPAGYLFAERVLPGSDCYGFRVGVVFADSPTLKLSASLHEMLTLAGKDADAYSQLSALVEPNVGRDPWDMIDKHAVKRGSMQERREGEEEAEEEKEKGTDSDRKLNPEATQEQLEAAAAAARQTLGATNPETPLAPVAAEATGAEVAAEAPGAEIEKTSPGAKASAAGAADSAGAASLAVGDVPKTPLPPSAPPPKHL